MQRAGAHDHEPGPELVAPVGADDPAGVVLVPDDAGDLGVEEGAVVEAELGGDAPAVLEDLGAVGVLLGRHVARSPRAAAGRRTSAVSHWAPGIAVPVPGAADVAALLDDADVVDAGLLEPGAGDEAGEAAADQGDGDLGADRVPLGPAGRRGRRVVGEGPGGLDVLLVAVLAQPLVALGPVAGEHGLPVDRGLRGRHGSILLHVPCKNIGDPGGDELVVGGVVDGGGGGVGQLVADERAPAIDEGAGEGGA